MISSLTPIPLSSDMCPEVLKGPKWDQKGPTRPKKDQNVHFIHISGSPQVFRVKMICDAPKQLGLILMTEHDKGTKADTLL